MKKIFVITGIITLLCILAGQGYAEYSLFESAAGEHFMRFDAKDAYNRPVESNYSFQTTPFFKIYSMLTSFGICRWRSSSLDTSAKITRNRVFKVPLGIVSFIYSERKILPRFSKKIVTKIPFNKFNIYLLMLTLILIFEPNLQSKNEPRFRVPVLIE